MTNSYVHLNVTDEKLSLYACKKCITGIGGTVNTVG